MAEGVDQVMTGDALMLVPFAVIVCVAAVLSDWSAITTEPLIDPGEAGLKSTA